MPSFTCSMMAFLYEPARASADAPGLKGYNVYHSKFQLQGSEIAVSIAHMTLKTKYPHGTLAYVVGSANFYEGSLLIVATIVIPAALAPRPDSTCRGLFYLPRFTYSGFVSSAYQTIDINPECFGFDVTVVRRNVWPAVPVVISSWINRDANRLTLHGDASPGTPVTITGIICGWTVDNTPMVDVHTISFTRSGRPSPFLATDARNPFERADFRDGYALYDEVLTHPGKPQANILSLNAPATLILRPMRAPPSDPRIRPGTPFPSPTEGEYSVSKDDTVQESAPSSPASSEGICRSRAIQRSRANRRAMAAPYDTATREVSPLTV